MTTVRDLTYDLLRRHAITTTKCALDAARTGLDISQLKNAPRQDLARGA